MKKFRMLLTILMVSVCSLQSVWAQDPVEVEVSLLEPNSLSTEIQKYVDDVKTVTKLTVSSGTIGELDWKTMQSLDALQTLDLSGATFTAVPDNQFGYTDYRVICPNLVTVILPNGVKTIGNSAFSRKSELTTVTIPSTLTTLGESAFESCSSLQTCSLADCNITTIPAACFYGCSNLASFTIPATVTSIGGSAFYYCKLFTSVLPPNLESLGTSAFDGAAMTDLDIVFPENFVVEYYVFRDTQIKSITFPTTYPGNNSSYSPIDGCKNLTDITLKSATVSPTRPNTLNVENITLHVPSHLVASYKTDSYWKDYKDVVAISPAITSYTVFDNLDLASSAMRMDGTPSIFIEVPNYGSRIFKISGESAQTFNDFTASARPNFLEMNDYLYKCWTMILSECPNVSINGDFKQRIRTDAGGWYFLCLPFDFDVESITTESGQFAIRTYNGALRNTADESTSGNNWTNLTSGTVTAGTGFIFQTSKYTWTTFVAKKGGTNYAFKTSSDVLNIPLAENNTNTSASAANTGWNMVGNPWMTYYNAHKLNYTAPFCYFNGSTYQTISISDDDYAIKPFQAIFVQCPTGVSEIGFPASGRQLTDEITNQNGSRALFGSDRKLIDIQITCGEELKDKTRLVVNPEALFDYEIGRDASKFFSSETLCPQIYSLDVDGTQYAINERPDINSEIRLGIVFASDGTYEISAPRNAIGNVTLTDNETGIETDLSETSYSFEAKKGTNEKRFTLKAGSRGTTGIQTLTQPETNDIEVFTIDGQNVGKTTNGLKKGVYVVRQGKSAKKVIIK